MYHRGRGHDIERCISLKNKIQDMFDVGEMKPQKEHPSNKENPLFNHAIFEGKNPVMDCSHRMFSEEPKVCGIRVYALPG